MAKKVLLTIAVLVIVAGIAFFRLKSEKLQEATAPILQYPAPGEESVPEAVVIPEGRKVITYTDSGFLPNPLTIKAGDAVEFVNESSNPFWPASAVHPTHKVYPGSDIEKCGTADAPKIFDACKGIPVGES